MSDAGRRDEPHAPQTEPKGVPPDRHVPQTAVGAATPEGTRGHWALITGASSGIGEAFARSLARRGWNVILTARREERLEQLAGELAASHQVRAAVIPADLAEPGAAARLWTEATQERRIEMLVNNAGFGLHGRFDELPVADQVRMVQLNCTAVMELAHFAVSAMRDVRGGAIINVASTAAFQPVPLMATYAATKAFVLSLSHALWAENRRHRIRVLALCPGPVPTEFQEVAGTRIAGSTPGYRTPEDVVDAALDAVWKGDSYTVPGTANHIGAVLARAAPLSLATRAAKLFMEKMR